MPMKVNDLSLTPRGMQPQQHVERTPVATTQTPFSRQLTKLGEDKYRAHIENLVDAIAKQGEKLGQRADMTELQKYRTMITELMNETVSNSYIFTKNNAFDARGRHRVYAMIKKVNTNLDDIAQEVLSEQKDNLRILDAIDDIRGLLLDIYL